MLFGQRTSDVPDDASSRTPMDQAMALLIDLLTAVQHLTPSESTSGDSTLNAQLREWARAQQRPDTSPRTARAAIVIWTRLHGIVSLELTCIFDGQAVEVQRLIELEVENALQLLRPDNTSRS